MNSKINQVKEEVARRASKTLLTVVRKSLNSSQATVIAQELKKKYPGLPHEALADILIKNAAKRTKWEGFINGLGLTGCEVVLTAPAPEPTHKIAAWTGIVTLLVSDIAYTTRIQMQLLLTIAELYECPFAPDDEEDVWIVFQAALGLKGSERVSSYGRKIFAETARKQFRKLLRGGIRRAVQQRVVKFAGPRVGGYLAEKSLIRLVPIVNAVIGYAFNNKVTKGVGKWAKVKAKIRTGTFKRVSQIKVEEPKALVWVLPLIFYVGTVAGNLTDNVLTLYSQTNKRLALNAKQKRYVEILIHSDEALVIFAAELPKIRCRGSRKALYDIVLITAAINLTPTRKYEDCLKSFAKYLNVKFNHTDLKNKVKYFKS